MKLDRHKPAVASCCRERWHDRTVFPLLAGFLRGFGRVFDWDRGLYLSLLFFLGGFFLLWGGSTVWGQSPPASSPEAEEQAVTLIDRVLQQLVHGPAFDAKVRETVWTSGREVVGVGTYEQAGGGTGRYNLQVTMHDGEGKHRLHQISDGRLAWTRTEVADEVALRRVDVGRLDQWVKAVVDKPAIAPSRLVGGWTEMLRLVADDYRLTLATAQLQDDPVWVIVGTLRDERREQILQSSGRESWPALYPTRVRIAVRASGDSNRQFGKWLPVRFEYWSDPVPVSSDDSTVSREGRLITLIELYSLRPIDPPPLARFRFDNQEAEVNFINDTDRYIQRYGLQLTDSQRRALRR